MNGIPNTVTNSATRRSRGSIGVVDVDKPLFTQRFERERRKILSIRPEKRGCASEIQTGTSRAAGRFAVTVKDFKNMFRRKSEDSMQERAEQSRKIDEAVDEYDQTTHNLDDLIEQIREKRKSNG